MKFTYLSILMLILLPGCAALGMNLFSDENSTDNDPIAQAAAKLRNDPAFGADRSPAQDGSFVPQNELTLGMTMKSVRSLWGRPQDVETAGDASQGNQRWTYFDGLSGRWGISNTRTVYFERGRVVGWESGH